MTIDLVILVWVAFWAIPLVGFLAMRNDYDDSRPGGDEGRPAGED